MLLNPFIGTVGVGAGGGGGPTYFFEERFEGTGYQNTWSETGTTGTANEDYTTSPLEGTQSLLLSATAAKAVALTTFASDVGELWGFFKLRIDTALSANRTIIAMDNASATQVMNINITTTNTLLPGNGSLNGTATVDAMTTGTNYNIWWHWIKGTGANGITTVGFSSGTTEVTAGNAFASKTNGNSTTDCHAFNLGTLTNTTFALVFDQFLMSTTGTIGNNPA